MMTKMIGESSLITALLKKYPYFYLAILFGKLAVSDILNDT